MIDFSNAVITSFIVHIVGNKANNEGIVLTDEETPVDDDRLNKKLLDFFAKPFAKREDYYAFHHSSDISLNEAFTFSSAIFNDKNKLGSNSRKFAKHLYDCSNHPNINPGELIVVLIENLSYANARCNALGLFKSESKDTILKVVMRNDNYTLKSENGIGDKNLEKCCLVLNIKEEEGFRMLVNDNSKGAGDEAAFWRDDFLKIVACSDNYHYTSNFMKLSKSFISERVMEEAEVSKTDQMDMLNKSVQYFKDNERFNASEFADNVFGDKKMVSSFFNYRDEVSPENDLGLGADNFEISSAAVKRNARDFKSVLKLDKNFHVYVHGDRNLIENGYDEERGMRFYKIFYKEEK